MAEDGWLEVRETTVAMIEHWGPIAEKKPDALVKSEDFNSLLARAKVAFENSPAIRDLKPAESVVSVADLIGKLAIIAGAAKSAFTSRNVQAFERHNQQARRSNPFPR